MQCARRWCRWCKGCRRGTFFGHQLTRGLARSAVSRQRQVSAGLLRIWGRFGQVGITGLLSELFWPGQFCGIGGGWHVTVFIPRFLRGFCRITAVDYDASNFFPACESTHFPEDGLRSGFSLLRWGFRGWSSGLWILGGLRSVVWFWRLRSGGDRICVLN